MSIRRGFTTRVTEIVSMYPSQTVSVLMNLLGTHDTERILTALVAEPQDYSLSNEQKAGFRLSPERREYAVRLLKLASMLEFMLPGMPSVFYGDEAGMKGSATRSAAVPIHGAGRIRIYVPITRSLLI